MARASKTARRENVELRVSANLPEVLSTRLAAQPLGGRTLELRRSQQRIGLLVTHTLHSPEDEVVHPAPLRQHEAVHLPPFPNQAVGQSGVRRKKQTIGVDVAEGRPRTGEVQQIPHEAVMGQPKPECVRSVG